MMATEGTRMAVLADHIHGCPAGRPVGVLPLARRKTLCDGCGKTKLCKQITIYNTKELVIDLCDKCRAYFVEEVKIDESADVDDC